MMGSMGPWVVSLQELKDGRILMHYRKVSKASTEKDLEVFNPKTGKFEKIIDTNFYKTKDIYSCRTDNKHTYSIGDTSFYYDCSNNAAKIIVTNGQVKAYLSMEDGTQIDFSEVFENFSYSSGIIGTDFSECMFFSVLNGLIKVSPKESVFTNYLDKQINSWDYGHRIRAIEQLKTGKILVSSEPQMLTLIDIKSGSTEELSFTETTSHKNLQPAYSFGMHAQNDSIVWLAPFSNELQKLNLSNRTCELIPQVQHYRNFHLIALRNGHLLSAGRDKASNLNLIEFEPDTRKTTKINIDFGTSSSPVINGYLLESINGNIWLGYSNGLFKIDIHQKKILASYRNKNYQSINRNLGYPEYLVLDGNSVHVLHEARDGSLWIGLDLGGINILDLKTNAIKPINQNDGLPNQPIAGIIADDNGYWISTYYGLVYYENESQLIRKFYSTDGLPHNEFNRFSFTKDDQGTLYFGGMNGMTSFLPDQLLHRNEVSKINLCKATHFDRKGAIKITRFMNFKDEPQFTIPSNNRMFSFDFMLSKMKSIEGNSFSYRIIRQGLLCPTKEDEWRQNGSNRTIQMDYLSSGNYELHVKGTTAFGAQSNIFKIKIHVLYHFYETWWFITLIGLTIISLIYLYYRMRVAQMIRMDRLRANLSSDLHDDVGSLLSGVAYQMELLEYSVDDKRKSLVRQIAGSSRKAMNQMRDVVWAIDSRNNTCEDLIARMQDFADQLLEPLNIKQIFEVEQEIRKLKVPNEYKHPLLMIFQEFLTNTVKHADAEHVQIKIYLKGTKIAFHFADDGIGLTDDISQKAGQGPGNMKRRAEKMNASLEFHSQEGFGITLLLPAFR
jgi:anti-sigma regulatory factor (Ser/Thr protein kinase)